MRTTVNSPDAPAAIGPYSQAVKHNGLLAPGERSEERSGQALDAAACRANVRHEGVPRAVVEHLTKEKMITAPAPLPGRMDEVRNLAQQYDLPM